MVHADAVTSSYYSSSPLLVSTAMKSGKIASLSCHSQAPTAVCVPRNPRSAAIVPRRADRALVVDNAPLLDVKYTRLLDGRRYAVGAGGEGSLGSRIPRNSLPSCRRFLAGHLTVVFRQGLRWRCRRWSPEKIMLAVVLKVSLLCRLRRQLPPTTLFRWYEYLILSSNYLQCDLLLGLIV